MLNLGTVYAGAGVTINALFALADGTPADPTAVMLTIAQGAVGFTPVTYTYDGTGVAITRSGVGLYAAAIDTTGLPGAWVGQWVGTGVCQVPGPFQFIVRALPFAVA